MAQSEKKKQKQGKPEGISGVGGITSLWEQKRPVFLFVAGFSFLVVAFFVFINSAFFTTHINFHILSANAKVSGIILNLFGFHTHVTGEMISSPAFSITVARGCDAVEGIALFTAAIITFPAKWRKKFFGLLAGITFLFVLNLIRIISLFIAGIYFPKAFPILHEEIWQGLFIICVVGVMIFWIRWSGKTATYVEI